MFSARMCCGTRSFQDVTHIIIFEWPLSVIKTISAFEQAAMLDNIRSTWLCSINICAKKTSKNILAVCISRLSISGKTLDRHPMDNRQQLSLLLLLLPFRSARYANDYDELHFTRLFINFNVDCIKFLKNKTLSLQVNLLKYFLD